MSPAITRRGAHREAWSGTGATLISDFERSDILDGETCRSRAAFVVRGLRKRRRQCFRDRSAGLSLRCADVTDPHGIRDVLPGEPGVNRTVPGRAELKKVRSGKRKLSRQDGSAPDGLAGCRSSAARWSCRARHAVATHETRLRVLTTDLKLRINPNKKNRLPTARHDV
jgi:hypothetical protein